ncbi:MAG TPA: hypothetical protein VIU37_03300 [Candidatus Limnocylindrales bacterium]
MSVERPKWHDIEAAGELGIETFIRPALIASYDPTIVVMRILEDGTYALTWSVNVRGDKRTLPEVETFIARVAEYINDLPVGDD